MSARIDDDDDDEDDARENNQHKVIKIFSYLSLSCE